MHLLIFGACGKFMMQTIISEVLADPELRTRYFDEMLAPSIKMMDAQLKMRETLGQTRSLDSQLASRFICSLVLGTFITRTIGDDLIDKEWDSFAELSAEIIFDGIASKKTK